MVSNRHLKMCLGAFSLQLALLHLMRDLEKEQAAGAMRGHTHVSLLVYLLQRDYQLHYLRLSFLF